VTVIMDRLGVFCNAPHNGDIAKAYRQMVRAPLSV
jgi:hypothetical protein